MITFISVVRDFKMYDKLVQKNPYAKALNLSVLTIA